MNQPETNWTYSSPPVEFEQRTGLTGISRQWVMPEGKSHEQHEKDIRARIEPLGKRMEELRNQLGMTIMPGARRRLRDEISRLSKERGRILNSELDKLVELNPELKDGLKIDRNNPREVFDAVLGITSQMNLDDINDFISYARAHSSPYGKNTQKNIRGSQYQTLLDRIKERYGSITWVPSMATLQKIKAQMEEPEPSKPKTLLTRLGLARLTS